MSSTKVGTMQDVLLTTVVGSYPQPDWLVDRAMLGSRLPPRTRALEIWRVAPEHLEQAHDDATVLAIRDLERAGVDIITDGEIRRESYSNRFATALEGIDLDNPGTALDRTGHPNPVPRVVGPIRRTRPVEVRDVEFLRANTTRRIKATLPGPFTMSQQAQDDYYHDEEALALALADAVNEEVRDLFAAGADVVQLDEPYLQARAEKAKVFAIKAIDRALQGITGTTALHTCFGYAHIVHSRPNGYPFLEELADVDVNQISMESAQQKVDLSVLKSLPGKTLIVGVIDLADDSPVEDVEIVAERIRNALRFVEPERLILAPGCKGGRSSRHQAAGAGSYRRLQVVLAGDGAVGRRRLLQLYRDQLADPAAHRLRAGSRHRVDRTGSPASSAFARWWSAHRPLLGTPANERLGPRADGAHAPDAWRSTGGRQRRDEYGPTGGACDRPGRSGTGGRAFRAGVFIRDRRRVLLAVRHRAAPAADSCLGQRRVARPFSQHQGRPRLCLGGSRHARRIGDSDRAELCPHRTVPDRARFDCAAALGRRELAWNRAGFWCRRLASRHPCRGRFKAAPRRPDVHIRSVLRRHRFSDLRVYVDPGRGDGPVLHHRNRHGLDQHGNPDLAPTTYRSGHARPSDGARECGGVWSGILSRWRWRALSRRSASP